VGAGGQGACLRGCSVSCLSISASIFPKAQPTNPPASRQIAGVDLDEMMRGAMGKKLDLNEPLVNYESPSGDLVQVWLE
jgi:hypothetical protein